MCAGFEFLSINLCTERKILRKLQFMKIDPKCMSVASWFTIPNHTAISRSLIHTCSSMNPTKSICFLFAVCKIGRYYCWMLVPHNGGTLDLERKLAPPTV